MKKKIVQIREGRDAERVALSIYHDNLQLRKAIGEKDGMEVIVESAVSKTSVRMLFGKVTFSGAYDPTEAGVDASHMRGADVIILDVLELISADLSKFPFKIHDGIKILQLRGEDIPEVDRKTEDITSKDVSDFFAPCTGRVDVILDPIQHENHTFYPYFEGTRKLAPQFRSHGVGYIRLGDDMSNFGTAFISLDNGKTFLDGGANDRNVMNSSSSRAPLSAKKKPRAIAEDAPTKEQVQSAKKVRIQTVSKGSEVDLMSKSMPIMKLPAVGVLTRSAARRAAQEAATAVQTATTPETVSEPPLSARKRNRQTMEENQPAENLSSGGATVAFASPEPSAKKPKLAESLRRSVRASRSKLSYGGSHDSSSLPTPKKLNMNTILDTAQLEEAINGTISQLQEIDQSGAGSSAWKTKVDIVKRLQQDLQQLPTEDIGHQTAVAVAQRLLDVVREQMVKTSNPMYTVTVVEVVPTVASVFLSSTSPLSTQLEIAAAWVSVLTECFQHLRNSNRQIELAANRTLTALSQQSLITWSVMTTIMESWLGLSANSSAPKNLLKLNKVLEFLEQRVLVDGTNAGSSLFQPSETTMDLFPRLMRIGIVGTKDRDEKNRVAAMQFIAAIVVADVLVHHIQQATQDLPTVAEVTGVLINSPSAWLNEELAKANLPISKVTTLVDKVLPRFTAFST